MYTVVQIYNSYKHINKKESKNPKLYVFQYKDHLGNVRLSYADINNNGSIEPASEILEENNYYPFGLKHQGYNELANVNRSEQAEKYQYNGKEWNDALGLNIYEMDLRQYDPAIGRWTVQDPVIHHEFSPYSAFDNNPVYWADPSGADAVPVSVMDLFNSAEGDITTFTFVNGSLIGTETYMVEELLQNLYELRPLEGTEYEGSKGNAYGGGHGNGGGNGDKNVYVIKRGSKAVKDTGKAAELISTLDEILGKNSKLFGKFGKIGGWMAKGGEVVYDGIEWYEGKISGYRFSFRLGTVVTSAVVGAEVGTSVGGPYGFAAGTAIGLVAGAVEGAWDVWFPQFEAGMARFYNNIIYNISRYH